MLDANHLAKLRKTVIDKLSDRIEKRPDNFTNTELLNALNIVQMTTDKSVAYVNSINEKPQIQLVSNNLNVTVDNSQLPKESRERIISAATALLELFSKNEGQPSSEEYLDLIATEDSETTDHTV